MARLVIELTDRCNLRCKHCPSGRHGGRKELPLTLFTSLLDEIKREQINIGHFAFTGGEPTLHSQFNKLVQITANAGLKYSMVTNGWSLPNHLDSLLNHRKHLQMITFSLDGACQATHDALRGQGSFYRVLQAVSTCVLRGLPFGFNMTLTRHNYLEAEALVELGEKLGALGVRFGHLMSDTESSPMGLEMTLSDRKVLDAKLIDLQNRSGYPMGLAPGSYSKELFPCSPLNDEEYNLHWSGELGLCCHLSGFTESKQAVAGNLHYVDLKTALHKLDLIRDQLKADKQKHFLSEGFEDEDFFPCRYCSKQVRSTHLSS